MSTATASAPDATGLRPLGERFRAGLGRIPPALNGPLDTYVAVLVDVVEEAMRASAAALAAVEARATAAVAGEVGGHAALLAAVEEARRSYGDALLDVLEGEPLAATADEAGAVVSAVLETLEGLADGMPPALSVPQEPARFQAAPGDASVVRAAKAGKRVLRLVRRQWRRTIPVTELVRFHAAVFEAEAGLALGDVRRLRVLAISAVYRLYRATAQVLDDVRGSAFIAAAGRAATAVEVLAAQRTPLEALAEELREAIVEEAQAIETGVDAAVRRTTDGFRASLETAGTIERPARTVAAARAARERDRARTAREDASAAWDRYERALADSLAAEVEVGQVAAAARLEATKAAAAVGAAVERSLSGPLAALCDAVRAVGRGAEAVFSSAADPSLGLEALEREIQDAFERGGVLVEAGDGGRAALASPFDALRTALAALPECVQASRQVARLAIDRVPGLPPRTGAHAAPIRRLVAVQLGQRLDREIDELLEAAGPELDELRAEVRRIRQAAGYNIAVSLRTARSAAGEADREPNAGAAGTAGVESTRELVAGVLERAVARLDALIEAAARLDRTLADGVRERVDRAAGGIVEAVRSRDAVEIRERVLVEATRKRVDRSLVSGRRALRLVVERARSGAARLLSRVQRATSQTRARLGLAEVEKAEILTRLDEAVLDARVTAGLPLIYRQLFTLDPLEWEDFLVGRERDLETVRRAFERWRAGNPATLAIHGERGSGKTTLVNIAGRTVLDGSIPVTMLALDPADRTEPALAARLGEALGTAGASSLEELAARVRGGSRRIVIVEGTESLFLRTIGGFDLLRGFLDLVTATDREVFWIVVMGRFGWRYLDRVIGIRASFAFEIDTTTLDPGAIEAAILARHTVSGYALRFEPDDRLRASRRWRRAGSERARQELARRAFLDQLERIAGGNIFAALFHWLRSIRGIEEHTLVVGPPRMIDVGFLEQLPLETLHTLAAVIQHGSVSAAEHARIFHREPRSSRLHLAALADENLLLRGDDGRFRVGRVLYRPFVRLLESKNIFPT